MCLEKKEREGCFQDHKDGLPDCNLHLIFLRGREQLICNIHVGYRSAYKDKAPNGRRLH
jgi:hypothetical protein